MKEITRDIRNNHIAYYNHQNIPVDFLTSRISILDRLDEIGDYTPTTETTPEVEVDNDYLNEQGLIVLSLFIIAVIITIYTIKDKKKLKDKIMR